MLFCSRVFSMTWLFVTFAVTHSVEETSTVSVIEAVLLKQNVSGGAYVHLDSSTRNAIVLHAQNEPSRSKYSGTTVADTTDNVSYVPAFSLEQNSSEVALADSELVAKIFAEDLAEEPVSEPVHVSSEAASGAEHEQEVSVATVHGEFNSMSLHTLSNITSTVTPPIAVSPESSSAALAGYADFTSGNRSELSVVSSMPHGSSNVTSTVAQIHSAIASFAPLADDTDTAFKDQLEPAPVSSIFHDLQNFVHETTVSPGFEQINSTDKYKISIYSSVNGTENATTHRNASEPRVHPKDDCVLKNFADDIARLQHCPVSVPETVTHTVSVEFYVLTNACASLDVPKVFELVLRKALNDWNCTSVQRLSFTDGMPFVFTFTNASASISKCDKKELSLVRGRVLGKSQAFSNFSAAFLPFFHVHSLKLQFPGDCPAHGNHRKTAVVIVVIVMLVALPCIVLVVAKHVCAARAESCAASCQQNFLRPRKPFILQTDFVQWSKLKEEEEESGHVNQGHTNRGFEENPSSTSV